jgi:hypothetical protein
MKDVNASVVQPVEGYLNGGVMPVIKSTMEMMISVNAPWFEDINSEPFQYVKRE